MRKLCVAIACIVVVILGSWGIAKFFIQTTSKNSVKELMALEDNANDLCRGRPGDDPVGMNACVERDKYDQELEAKGWCWISLTGISADADWHKCSDTSVTVTPAPASKYANQSEISQETQNKASDTSELKMPAFDFVLECKQSANETIEVFALTNGLTLFAFFNGRQDVADANLGSSFMSYSRNATDFSYSFDLPASDLIDEGPISILPNIIRLSRTDLSLYIKDALTPQPGLVSCAKSTKSDDKSREDYHALLDKVERIKIKQQRDKADERQKALDGRKL